MIQRIQTLWLALIVVLGVLLCFFSPVSFVSPEGTSSFRELTLVFSGLFDVTDPEVPMYVMNTVSLSILSVCIPLLALTIVFLWRKRILQARLGVVNAVLCLGWYAVLAVYVWFAHMKFYVSFWLTPWAAVPLVNLILDIMAVRAILKDEAIVRGADRLRK